LGQSGACQIHMKRILGFLRFRREAKIRCLRFTGKV